MPTAKAAHHPANPAARSARTTAKYLPAHTRADSSPLLPPGSEATSNPAAALPAASPPQSNPSRSSATGCGPAPTSADRKSPPAHTGRPGQSEIAARESRRNPASPWRRQSPPDCPPRAAYKTRPAPRCQTIRTALSIPAPQSRRTPPAPAQTCAEIGRTSTPDEAEACHTCPPVARSSTPRRSPQPWAAESPGSPAPSLPAPASNATGTSRTHPHSHGPARPMACQRSVFPSLSRSNPARPNSCRHRVGTTIGRPASSIRRRTLHNPVEFLAP